MIRRNTIQKELVLNAVKDMRSHVSAEEVYDYISQTYSSIGKGTIYRNLSILSEEGQIRKVNIPDGSDVYDHLLHEHYHIRCRNCGKVEDLYLNMPADLKELVQKTKGFEIETYDLVFKGLCPNCIKKEGDD